MLLVKLRIQITAAIISLCMLVYAQDIPIGQWRMHLSHKQGVTVAEANGKIFCATKGSIFSYNKSDNSLEVLSKLTGLSDIAVNAINFDPTSNTLIIAYKNANIDIIQNGVITNLIDIKIKSIQGNKSINNIFFKSGNAYLACGFGIVVLDLNKHETKDTYYIGPAGSALNVKDINSDGVKLYAATTSGIYTAPLNSINLADYNSWTKETGLPTGVFNTLAYFNGNMYANYSKNLTSNAWFEDSLYKFNGTTWSVTAIGADNFKRLRVANNKLTAVGEYGLRSFNTSETQIGSTYNNYGFGTAWIADGLIDNNDIAWMADNQYGLVKVNANAVGEKLSPNGPRTTSVFAMNYSDGVIWSVPGAVTYNWGANIFNADGVSKFSENTWFTFTDLDTLHDIVCVAIDPQNSDHAYVGSYLHGVIEFNNNAVPKVYNPTNSPLKSQLAIPSYYSVRIGGMTYDDEGNLWVVNSETDNCIAVKKKDGNWITIDFSKYQKLDRAAYIIDAKNSGQKWIVLPSENSIIVYNNNAGFPSPNAANTYRISNVQLNINGNNIPSLPAANILPGTLIKCIAEDKDGAMWVGSDKGIAVVYSPENIFNGGGWYPQQILLEQDGHTQILLETESITAIAVDAANRKWIGTQKSGVFLMSSDGTKQIYHFDESNSPILSNEINCITINDKTGEVFFGTINGIVSYKSTATEGGEDFEDVYAYPNPVKHDYSGTIAIKGLAANADVKITDISGALIFQTKALGGQAIWDGKSFNGERAQTGVYMVFCNNQDGSKTFVTKILFVN